jgi:AraC-like DNA-binding protein
MPQELARAMERYIATQGGADGAYEAMPGLFLMRSSQTKLPRHMVYRPCLCMVAQGEKRLLVNERTYDYGEFQALVVGLDLPAFGWVTKASPDRPYFGISLELDATVIQDVMNAMDSPVPSTSGGAPGVFVTTAGPELVSSVTRLVELLDNAPAVPVLSPSIIREIVYWLLVGPHGDQFVRLALPDGHTRRIADAIRVLRDRFDQPLRMEELAGAARMSPSAFYQHFKALTAMSPLQYQKQLRLTEARRMMLSGAATVAGAAYEVGYESPSQFSREYARMFGIPPKRDSLALRHTDASGMV